MTSIGFRIASFPSFMVLILAVCDFYEMAPIKMMLNTKLVNSNSSVFNTVRVGNNECLHFASLSNYARSLNLSTVFSREFLAKIGTWFAKKGFADLSTGFKRKFPSKTRSAHFSASDGRKLSTQSRARNPGNVKAFLAEGIELIKPILFTSKQKWTKHEFNDFKDEGLFSVLIPSTLQLLIAMGIALKIVAMVFPSIVQVSGATNVEQARNSTGNLINARCSRDRGLLRMVQWGHGYMPPKQVCNLGFASASNICKTATISPIIPHKPAPCLALGGVAC